MNISQIVGVCIKRSAVRDAFQMNIGSVKKEGLLSRKKRMRGAFVPTLLTTSQMERHLQVTHPHSSVPD